MDKFSKIKRKTSVPKEEIKYQDEKLKIIKFEGWSIVNDRDCVVCIPYLIESSQIILRYEYIPTYKYKDGQEYHLTVVAGGIEEGETPDKAVVRELEEEAGIVLREDYNLEALKPLYISKGTVNKFFPYILPLNERDYHEVIAKGDGSEVEKMSKSVKVDAKWLDSLNPSDLITEYMILKLKEYLNL